MTERTSATEQPIDTVTTESKPKWVVIGFVGALSVLAVAAVFGILKDLLPATATDSKTIAQLGTWMVLVGIGLMVVALVIGLLELASKAFTTTTTVTKYQVPAGYIAQDEENVAAAPATFSVEIVKAVVGVAAELVKIPAGIGALVSLLGVSLLIGALVFGTPVTTETVDTTQTVTSDPKTYPTTQTITKTTITTTPAE